VIGGHTATPTGSTGASTAAQLPAGSSVQTASASTGSVTPAGSGAGTKTGLSSVTTSPLAAQRAPVRAPATPALFSRCPKLDGSTATKNLVLMLDSISPQVSGKQLDVAYDVCGLASGSPFMAQFTLRKVDQSRMRRLVRATFKPVVVGFPDVANSPRTRHHRMVSLTGTPGGQYAIDAEITDGSGRKQTATRTFNVSDRPVDTTATKAPPTSPAASGTSKPR
jgi:hypothetical protein